MRPRPIAKFGHRRLARAKILVFRQRLLKWWRFARRDFPWRRADATGYHHIVSEVLLQRTRAETVAAFWPLFISRFPNWRAVNRAHEIEITQLLSPIGLAKQRAPRLKALAEKMVQSGGRFPIERKRVEALPGVGQYIANAIYTLRHGKPQPLLDSNMARVLERYFGLRKLADIRYDPYLQSLGAELVRHPQGKAVNWAILDFGALICRPRNPHCDVCLLNSNCIFGSRNRNVLRKPPKI